MLYIIFSYSNVPSRSIKTVKKYKSMNKPCKKSAVQMLMKHFKISKICVVGNIKKKNRKYFLNIRSECFNFKKHLTFSTVTLKLFS